MIDAVYVGFFWILVVEVAIFCFINLPTPRGWKGKLIKFLTSSTKMRTFMKIHFGLCLLAALFFLDLSGTENHFQAEKHKLKNEGHGHMGAELRIGWLSYSILKVQRNKYITFMLIYASLALNIYIQLLYYMYKKRDDFENEEKELKQKESSEVKKQTTPVQDRKVV